jgi:alpha-1,6-mannosyltransferase
MLHRRAVRIAQLANFVGPRSGGMKTALTALAQGYVEAGHERLLVIPGPVDKRVETEHGTVQQLRSPRVGGLGYRLVVEPWRVTDVLESFRPTSLEISDKFTMTPVSWWARRNGIPSVLFSHERFDEYMLQYTRLDTTTKVSAALLNRILVRSFDAVVVTSDYARDEFEKYAPKVDTPVFQVPLGVDLELFQPRTHVESDVLRLIHVGRLSREKAPHLSVAAAVELHHRGVPVRLDVYGDGPARDELEMLAVDAPVTFHGYIGDREELAGKISAADVALSVCPGETFGLAVLEALAAGTPVVTADRGGAQEIITQACGAKAAPLPVPLADAVLEVASRPVSASRAAARARAEEFPWSRTISEMVELHAGVSEGALADVLA